MNLISTQHWLTKNDIRVYFVERHEIPAVEISVDFFAGSGFDHKNYGVSQLTNIMLPQGTVNLSAEQISAGFEEVGAHFDVTSDRDSATVKLRCLSEKKYLTPALKIYTEVLSAPRFPQKELLHMQKIVQSAIIHQYQTPEMIARNTFYETLYHHHPYAHPVLGTMRSVEAIKVDDLKNFYDQFYVSQNAFIILVGDLSLDKAKQIANQIGASLHTGQAAKALPNVPSIDKNVKKLISFPSEQTHILIGNVGVSLNDPNYFPLLVWNNILGGSPFTSRLFNEIRGIHGLAYGVVSAITPLKANGPFAVILQTNNKKANKALNIAKKTLDGFIKNGPSNNELITTKKRIINEFPLTIARNDNIVIHLRKMGLYQLPLNYFDKFIENINKLTIKQINTATKLHFQVNHMTTVMVGNFL